MTSLVAIIVVCWNNRQLLDDCLQSIYRQTFTDYRVVVVDNGSTDTSVAYLRAAHPAVTLIQAGRNTGFAGGNNIGLRHVLADEACRFVALVNTDARLAPDWLERLVSFAVHHPDGASFQAPTVDHRDHTTIDSYGLSLDRTGRAVQMGYRVAMEDVAPLTSRRVFGVNAAACLWSAGFLRCQPLGVDYFDSDLWMFLEDVDLATRAVMMGMESWLVVGSHAYHIGSVSTARTPLASVHLAHRNNVLVLVKNLPAAILVRVIPALLAANLATVVRPVRSGRYASARSILTGLASSVPLLPRFVVKRRALKPSWAISSRSVWRLMRTSA